ncbi:hypothetical protein 13VV501A_gene0015 [Vibrio phage 13VV501A]|nr:hypothetical protein 13VV501A_gene0015 [Vibrio phage 13VV501A]
MQHEYKPTGIIATVRKAFVNSNDSFGVYAEDEGCISDDRPQVFREGYEFEYFCTRSDGYHFVYDIRTEFGTWVHPALLELPTRTE